MPGLFPKPISLDYLSEKLAHYSGFKKLLGEHDWERRGKVGGDMSIDQEALLVSWKGQAINLSGTEFRMLSQTRPRSRPCGVIRHADECNHAVVGHQQYDQYLTCGTSGRSLRQWIRTSAASRASTATDIAGRPSSEWPPLAGPG